MSSACPVGRSTTAPPRAATSEAQVSGLVSLPPPAPLTLAHPAPNDNRASLPVPHKGLPLRRWYHSPGHSDPHGLFLFRVAALTSSSAILLLDSLLGTRRQ